MSRYPPTDITNFKSENQRRFMLIAEEIFGPYWQNPAAKALSVDPKQVKRWASGDYEPSDAIVEQLAAMARRKAAALMRKANRG